MEVEVSIQRYLKQKLGYPTPRITLPDDVAALADYGPLRLLQEQSSEADRHLFLQVQLPDIPMLKQIVVHLVEQTSGRTHELRLDALGSAPLALPDGTYSLGLVYDPA
jgi:hypothetical protein